MLSVLVNIKLRYRKSYLQNSQYNKQRHCDKFVGGFHFFTVVFHPNMTGQTFYHIDL